MVRTVDANTLAALKGSRAGDKLSVFVWKGGKLQYPNPLPISQYGFDWDVTRQVQKFTCEVTDTNGGLAPWLISDPLGVGGSQLQVRYDVGNAGSINLGWYRIANPKPTERWRSYIITNKGVVNPADSPLGKDTDIKYVSGGASISITAYDRAFNAKLSRFIAPESPPAGTSPTIISEIKRLMRDIAPVVVLSGVTDQPVSPLLVYPRERLNAIQDLCKRIVADYRMNGDGQMEIYSLAKTSSVATLQGGPEGLLVAVDREQNIDKLYNIFVVDGTINSSSGAATPVRSVQSVRGGELAVDGDFGRVPEFYTSSMIQSQNDADAYAFSMMQTQLSGMTVDLMVKATPQPWLQQGDWVTVANPIVDGQPVPLVGMVKAMTLSGKGAPDVMNLIVQCSYWDVQSAIGGARRVQSF